jgi:hypothetical protein
MVVGANRVCGVGCTCDARSLRGVLHYGDVYVVSQDSGDSCCLVYRPQHVRDMLRHHGVRLRLAIVTSSAIWGWDGSVVSLCAAWCR